MSDSSYRLRLCSSVSADADLLSLVAASSFLEAFAGILTGPDILAHVVRNNSPAAFSKYLADPVGRCVVAEALPGHAPVGYIVCCEPDLPIEVTPQDYELRRIYLLHRFQGVGIGRALMDAAFEQARALQRTRLLLGVYGKNRSAIRFYEKSGFQPVGERYFTVGSTTHHDLVMACPVA